MQSFRELPSLFSRKDGQENPHRTLLVNRLIPKILLAAIMIGTFFILSSSASFAKTNMSPSDPNGRVYCVGTQCNQYKAAQTHCIDSFRLLQDDPIYNGGIQVGTLRWWYSDTCNTYWSQVFSSNCTNIDQLQADIAIQGQDIATSDFGLEGGCSLSGHMLYDPQDTLEPVGGIHFTDSRGWVYS